VEIAKCENVELENDANVETDGYLCQMCGSWWENGSISQCKKGKCPNLKDAKRKNLLYKIIRGQIKGDKTYKCLQCPMQTNSKTRMKAHQLLHRDGPNAILSPVACGICSWVLKMEWTCIIDHKLECHRKAIWGLSAKQFYLKCLNCSVRFCTLGAIQSHCQLDKKCGVNGVNPDKLVRYKNLIIKV